MSRSLTLGGDELWKKIGESKDRVELRVQKAISILDTSGVPYAIVGENAVRIWVALDLTAKLHSANCRRNVPLLEGCQRESEAAKPRHRQPSSSGFAWP